MLHAAGVIVKHPEHGGAMRPDPCTLRHNLGDALTAYP